MTERIPPESPPPALDAEVAPTFPPLDEDELEEFEEFDYEADWQSKTDTIKARCAAAAIPVEELVDEDTGDYLKVQIRNGRDFRPIIVSDIGSASALLESRFEAFVFLGAYAAICSYNDGEIEAFVRPANQFTPSGVYRRLTGRQVSPVRASDEELTITIAAAPGENGPTLSLGPMSKTLAAMLGRGETRLRSPSLRVRGLSIAQHDQAVRLLERIANSLFFQIDLLANLPLTLVRERRFLPLVASQRAPFDPAQLQFPRFEYDQRAIQLYWYARSATGMPLLQFLAYYQCVEFYFPIYSQLDAHRRVRNILKNPQFSPHRDSDITELLSAVRVTTGRGFGDERTQLRSAIQECVTAEALYEFLTGDPDRLGFLSSKSQTLGVARLPIGRSESDLRAEIADRIYGIRCKIVHTKHTGAGEEVDLLLPFSAEADALMYDIQLAQFIARQVLVAASGPFAIEFAPAG
jgi:hypothetical protein